MPYWQNMQVHAQLYFAPPETSQFLSSIGTGLNAELMAIDATKERSGCTCTCQQKKKKENSQIVRLEHVATCVCASTRKLTHCYTKHVAAYVSASTESPSSTLQLLLP
jgi:hypothetical protein